MKHLTEYDKYSTINEEIGKKDILAPLKINLITTEYLETYIRDRKIKEIFYENSENRSN